LNAFYEQGLIQSNSFSISLSGVEGESFIEIGTIDRDHSAWIEMTGSLYWQSDQGSAVMIAGEAF
jgi:hypothetical protein